MKLDIGLLIIFTVVNVAICSFTSLWLNNNTEKRIRTLQKIINLQSTRIDILYDLSATQSETMIKMSETDQLNMETILKLSGLKK